ncbi:ras-specific guanine nucleotide-releasing factor 1-like isoform X1 [Anneissia japonica]|uniref:ras-specific guanine nucleotide-releasing factor 1-like isoform X1 n=2 Tax=Anneissia japonica TaxID=1529436 RepID=UPI00142566BD|nr:ras-specific guanine nucleotide-releasing factor 1-like isoform X1 [Anneissia japonica]XP_033120544.1 ras-specific guanine nucleotide-releasing factor 1-like isoform X1 [Anneissia japonica]
MQKAIRLDETQVLNLATKAKTDNSICGYLQKKSSDGQKWKIRWCALYQNLLFYYENDTAVRPIGVLLIEGCYCERYANARSSRDEKQYWYLTIQFRGDVLRQFEFRCETETECNAWVDIVQHSSFNMILSQKEELEQKYLHLLQILDSEKTAKLNLRQQCEELTCEVSKLKMELKKEIGELNILHRERKRSAVIILQDQNQNEQSEEMKQILKVQSFLRGWLCRRRWKAIVQDYIRSPHAESMRKRNNIVFNMVESEREYVEQLSLLVSCFLRPFKMAASAKKPIISHEEVNSIFLNSETIFFLHQIFYKGLSARMDQWPKLLIGDLFDMLLPMLSIYNEYVRNHHYSLQVLAECKQRPLFSQLLKQYETKPSCEGRSMEIFLTYPMHQVPRYILTLHELLAHTPHDHVERKSLEYAKNKLEELSRVMHDEVSETENIRKNLSIERMIVEGCDILLDVHQTFVRHGSLVQVVHERKMSRSRLGSLGAKGETKKEGVRQCFLFTKHLLITMRTSGGKLHLCKIGGKIGLMETTLVEDYDPFDDDGGCSPSEYDNLDFKLIVEPKNSPPLEIILVASTQQDKAAWTSDISQCIVNLHYNGLLDTYSLDSSSSSIHLPQCINPRPRRLASDPSHDSLHLRSDARLFKDDVDIRFSKMLNSCKVPQIRYATFERLVERLTDLRFLSIDFLNTFLLTYRIFSSWDKVLETLKNVYRNPDAAERLLNVCEQPSSPRKLPQTPEVNGGPRSPQTATPKSPTGITVVKTSSETSKPRSFDSNSSARIHPFRKSFMKSDRVVEGSGGVVESKHLLSTPPESPTSPEQPSPPDSPVKTMPKATSKSSSMLVPRRGLTASRSAPNIAALVNKSEMAPPSPKNTKMHCFSTSPPSQTASAGVVVTSSRQSTRRSSSSTAATAFAAATAGSSVPSRLQHRAIVRGRGRPGKLQKHMSREVLSSAATVRVINVIRHWVSKFPQDFVSDEKLKCAVIEFLEEISGNVNLLPTEHKCAVSVLRQLNQQPAVTTSTLETFMNMPPESPLEDPSFPAIVLAEQITYIDHMLLVEVPYWEFLNQAWMKHGKETKAPHILAVIRQFNETSKLVSSEIIRQPTVSARAAAIDKWAAVADMCRCMHNFNGVLEITSALMNSAVYRLKKVWDKVTKQSRATLEKLQILVSSDGRFKNMREALHRIDPPCVPYLGCYLTDLAFIEDGTPNISDNQLINFSKMRMIAHVIREIRHFQQTPYKVEPEHKVIHYLTDSKRILDDDELYALSLEMEPRQSTNRARHAQSI